MPTANVAAPDLALFSRIPPEMDENTPATAYRRLLQEDNQTLQTAFRKGVDVQNLVRGRAEMVDAILIRLWQRDDMRMPDGLCLVAVGGYGRGELFPHSDVDLLFLHQGTLSDSEGAALERYIALLWDIGIEVGQSVRTPEECASQAAGDVTIMTNLIEARALAGNTRLYEQMRDAVAPANVWPVAEFYSAKMAEQQGRHNKHQDSAYRLEPDVKDGPGGLRDFQTIAWVAMRHFGTATLHELVDHKFITEGEYEELVSGRAYLWKVRYALHSLTSRREERLLFDHQIQVAELFGYRDRDHNLAVEQFMQEHYRRIKHLLALNDMLLQLFDEAILHADDGQAAEPLDEDFQVRHGYIEVQDPWLFDDDPIAMLRLFHVMQRNAHITGIRAETLRLLRRHRDMLNDHLREDVRARSLFMSMLREPRGLTRALRRMNRYGLLGRYLPAFGRVIGMMQYDLFHTLTVDEHILFVLRNARRLALEQFDHEHPAASQIMQELDKPELLYIAALFHDISKGQGGDHSTLGSEEARAFCEAHGLPSADTALVCWLVQHHLLMSLTAQKQDVSDPAVVHDFAELVHDQKRLDYLYLLTVCDIRATNPKLWNSFRDSLLRELYLATQRALARGLESPIEEQELVRETQDAARALIRNDSGLPDDEIDKVWRRLDDDHFLRHAPEEIAWQTAAIAGHAGQSGPLVLVRSLAVRGTTVFVHTPDVDYLFGLTTAVLAQLGLTILDARIGCTSDQWTVDSYVLVEENGSALTDPQRQAEIASRLCAAISDPAVSKVEIRRRVPRQLAHFNTPTHIAFSQDAARGRTLVEISAADRPGLLSSIGRVFEEHSILVAGAKIGTIGERAEDVFFVTGADGNAITDKPALEQLRKALEQGIELNT